MREKLIAPFDMTYFMPYKPRGEIVWKASMGTFRHETPRVNQRKMRRLKNKALKIFLKHHGIHGRVKTHSLTMIADRSERVWTEFHQQWRNLTKQAVETVNV
jgi:hypothetical protein